MKTIFTVGLSLFVFAACAASPGTKTAAQTPSNPSLDGDYVLAFQILEDKTLSVNARIEGEQIYVFNGEETIEAVDVVWEGDLLRFRMPAFNNGFFLTVTDEGLSGRWHNYAKGDYAIPVTMVPVADGKKGEASQDVTGRWKVEFSKGTEDAYIALGIFSQNGATVTGTFRTTTGDYRYLEGTMEGDTVTLSCFDGSHAFLFEAEMVEGRLNGTFYSGKHWNEPWVANKAPDFELPDPDTLTFVKEGERFDFSMPNTEGEIVAFKDFAGKATIVQITGTWCPNCMDETLLLNDLYDKYHDRGLEIVALAFEPADDFKEATEYIERFAADLKVQYPILVAGTKDKGEAAEELPMLNHIMSFPTTLFFDKEGNLLKVHTGFNGPSTGQVYTDFVEEVTRLIEEKML